MQSKEVIRRYKVLHEKASILRAQLKKIDQEKKHLERLILESILHDSETALIKPFLVIKKVREEYHPDAELTYLYTKEKPAPWKFFKPQVTVLKSTFSKEELNDIGEFIAKPRVEVKLVEEAG